MRLIPRLRALDLKPSRRRSTAPASPIGKRNREVSSPITFSDPGFSSSLKRTKSIILDEINPVLHPQAYRVQKRAPVAFLNAPTQKGKGKFDSGLGAEVDGILSLEEVRLKADPYLRMLSSSQRRCLVTTQVLPSAFMLRLGIARHSKLSLPAGKSNSLSTYLIPDGLEHPRFHARVSGRGIWVLLWKDAFDELIERGSFKRLSSTARAHSLLREQIDHLLRQRVIQEAEFLADRLETAPLTAMTPRSPHALLTRLTRSEWHNSRKNHTLNVAEGDSLPCAALILPKPQTMPKIPTTEPSPKPTPSHTSLSQSSLKISSLSVLFKVVQPSSLSAQIPHLPSLPLPLIPVYNIPALFPDRTQRTALRAQLNRLLSVERRVRYHSLSKPITPSGQSVEDGTAPNPSNKNSSDIYVLNSDVNTSQRADSVPLAVALWRLRLWEGEGWRGDFSNNL